MPKMVTEANVPYANPYDASCYTSQVIMQEPGRMNSWSNLFKREAM